MTGIEIDRARLQDILAATAEADSLIELNRVEAELDRVEAAARKPPRKKRRWTLQQIEREPN